MTAGLIVSRFLHFAAVLLLFGAAAFPLYAFGETARAEQSAKLFARLFGLLAIAAGVALISGIGWLCFTAASMSGSLANALDPATLGAVIGETDFGRIWIWRLGLAAALAVLFAIPRQNDMLALARIGGSALLLTSISGTGHAGSDGTDWGTVHVAADSLHLLAAGAWIGGLVALGALLARAGDSPVVELHDVLQRFSSMGIAAVAALVASGILNALFEVDGFIPLLQTDYGRVLLLKIALFAGMVGYAAQNRQRVMPALAHEANTPTRPLRLLVRNVAAEQALAILVLAAVAYLGTLAPTHLQAE